MKVKVNVWQVGYATVKDWENQNPSRIEYVERGYVLIDEQEDWEEEVWHLLNWGCWNYNEDGSTTMPENVHVTIDHCNSDVILLMENTKVYKYAKSIGFGDATSLDEAVTQVKKVRHLWPLRDN
jgi:hypothetical protein